MDVDAPSPSPSNAACEAAVDRMMALVDAWEARFGYRPGRRNPVGSKSALVLLYAATSPLHGPAAICAALGNNGFPVDVGATLEALGVHPRTPAERHDPRLVIRRLQAELAPLHASPRGGLLFRGGYANATCGLRLAGGAVWWMRAATAATLPARLACARLSLKRSIALPRGFGAVLRAELAEVRSPEVRGAARAMLRGLGLAGALGPGGGRGSGSVSPAPSVTVSCERGLAAQASADERGGDATTSGATGACCGGGRMRPLLLAAQLAEAAGASGATGASGGSQAGPGAPDAPEAQEEDAARELRVARQATALIAAKLAAAQHALQVVHLANAALAAQLGAARADPVGFLRAVGVTLVPVRAVEGPVKCSPAGAGSISR